MINCVAMIRLSGIWQRSLLKSRQSRGGKGAYPKQYDSTKSYSLRCVPFPLSARDRSLWARPIRSPKTRNGSQTNRTRSASIFTAGAGGRTPPPNPLPATERGRRRDVLWLAPPLRCGEGVGGGGCALTFRTGGLGVIPLRGPEAFARPACGAHHERLSRLRGVSAWNEMRINSPTPYSTAELSPGKGLPLTPHLCRTAGIASAAPPATAGCRTRTAR